MLSRTSMRALAAFFGLAMLLSVLPLPRAAAQQPPEEEDTTAVTFGSGIGFEIALTNSGFGLGGQVRRAISPTASVLFELRIAPGKDPREAFFFDRFGRREIPQKYNYLLLMPLRFGVQHRLFSEHIEDNFRPHLHISMGPTFGWMYPYFEDENENRRRDEGEQTYGTFSALPRGEPRMGAGGTILIGAHFGERAVRSVRFGYEFSYFFEPIQLLEPRVREAQFFFGSPVISLTFGRLW